MATVTKRLNFDGGADDTADLVLTGDWVTTNAGWASTGTFSLRSKAIADNQFSQAIITFTLPANATNPSLTVDWKVSSEVDYDFLVFYANQQRTGTPIVYVPNTPSGASGNGTAKLTWGTWNIGASNYLLVEYRKNENGSALLDAAFIDNVVLTYTIPDGLDVSYTFNTKQMITSPAAAFASMKQQTYLNISVPGYINQHVYTAYSMVRDMRLQLYADRVSAEPLTTRIYAVSSLNFPMTQHVPSANFTGNFAFKTTVYRNISDNWAMTQITPVDGTLHFDMRQRMYELVSSTEGFFRQHITDLNNYLTDKSYLTAILSRTVQLQAIDPRITPLSAIQRSTINLQGEVAE